MEKDVPVDQIQLFLTKLDTDEEDEESISDGSTFEFITQKLKAFYIDNIPVDIVKELPNYGKYILGGICYAVTLAIFIYFTVQNYQTSINQKFISLDASSGDCKTVPIPITSQYYADASGNWEGTEGYQYYLSIYRFKFSNYIASNLKDYEKMMAIYRKTFEYFGEFSSHQNLGINSILWMSMVRFFSTENFYTTNFTSTGRGQLQYVELTGDPSVIFNSRYTGLAIASAHGFCQLPTTTNFDQSNAYFQSTIVLQSALNDSLCSTVAREYIIHRPVHLSPTFPIYLDVRSFSTALSVNFGFVALENLILASGDTTPFTIVNAAGSVTYIVGQYYDVRYPLMQPIFCLINSTILPPHWPNIERLCFVATSSAFFLPVVNHLGNSYSEPEYCDCASGIGKSDNCNDLSIIAGLIAFPMNSEKNSNKSGQSVNPTYLSYSFELVAMYPNYFAFNRASFNASSISVLQGLRTASPSVMTPAYLENAFGFCKLKSGMTCTLLTYYSLGNSHSVSTYHYPLINGSCANALTISDEAWQQLAANPPTPLSQDYYSCFPAFNDALLNAIGVASGNTSIAILLLMFVCVPTVILIMAFCKAIPKEQEYSDKEKARTLDTFATLILRVRDEHYEGINIDEKNIVAQITDELIDAVKVSNRGVIAESGKFNNEEFLRPNESFMTQNDPIHHRELLGKVLIYKHERKSRPLGNHSDSSLNIGNNNNPLRRQISRARSRGLPKRSPMRQGSSSGPGKTYPGIFRQPSSKGNFRSVVRFDSDLESGATTMRLRIMNVFEKEIVLPSGDIHWNDPYKSNELTILIEGMIFYFSNSIRNQVLHENDRLPHQSLASSPPLYEVDEDYAKGCLLAQQLLDVNVPELLQDQDPAVFNSLSNILCMHASLDLKKDMKIIASDYGDRVGYQIGNKIFTLTTVSAYSLLSPE